MPRAGYSRPVTYAQGVAPYRNATNLNAMQDGLANYVDARTPAYDVVMDFGADPTGATDSAAEINSAIFTMNSLGGGTIYFPPGEYLANDTIFVYSNVTFLGAGRDQTIVKASATLNLSGAAWIKNYNYGSGSITDVKFQSMTFDGNISARGAAVAGAGANLEFRGAVGAQCARLNFIDCKIQNYPGIGIAFIRADDGMMVGNFIENGDRDALHLGGNNNRWQILNNNIFNTADDQIAVHGGNVTGDVSTDVIVANNILRQNLTLGSGITLSSTDRCVVTGNIIRNSYAAGISIYCDQLNPTKRTVISNNVIDASGQGNTGPGDGINIANASGSFYTTPNQAIIEDTTIEGNHFFNTKGYAIRMDGQSAAIPIQTTSVTGNHFITIGTLCLRLEDFIEGFGADGNVIREVQGRAFDVIGSGCKDVMLTNNRIKNTNKGGAGAVIRLGALANGIITGNRLWDTQGTKTMTLTVDWSTAVNTMVAMNNFDECGGSYTGTQGSTNKRHSNILNTGTFEHGDTT